MQLERTVDSKTREFLNYSQRCAYKALKRLTPNKNLNFKPEVWKETPVRSRASTDRSIADTDESSGAESKSPESESGSSEFSFFREMQRRLRETWATKIEEQGVKYKLLKSDSGKSSIVPAKSLTKSAFSTKFAKYETWRDRSANVLDAIPKVSCFRRKNRDRCLSCMHKSLCKTDETEAVITQATLPTEIEARDVSESSSSDGLSKFREELREILYSQRKEILRRPEMVEDVPSKSTSPSLQVEQEEISIKIDPNQSKDKAPKPTESLLSKDPKSLKATSSSISISSDIERSKISSSQEAPTSDDETSSPLALENDPSQYKNMAPCHLPTILLPSMEPLRALRYREATTMESRIALMESAPLTKEKSDDEYYDDVKIADTTKERSSPSKTTGGKPEDTGVEKDTPSKAPRALLKVKSQQQLISPIVESAQKGELKRGYSCASIKDLSEDSTRRTFEIPRSEAEGRRGKVIPFEEIDSAKGSTSSESVEAEGRAELPLSTVAEVSQFLKKMNRGDVATATMLESLANEFSSRMMKQYDTSTAAGKKRAKLAARLTKLLVDSKRYLNPDKFPSDLIFSAQQPPACNTRLLRRVLPLDSYNLIAPLLGMPVWYPKRAVRKDVGVHYDMEKEEEEKEEEEETEGDIPFDLIVHPPTTKDISTNGDEHKVGQARSNPYALFLKKPRRKVVTWRPLTAADLKGYDPEATLEMRARNITDRICRDFCEWLRSLGGTDKVIDEEVLRDMFEIDFTGEASRTMEMSIRELPMVPNEVAAARQCHDAGELAMTRKHLIRDAKAESKPAKTMAFGTAIPWQLRFVPPGNQVRQRWLRCENVMKDLETMDVVWKDITHLESVKAFAKWFSERSKTSLPDALIKAMTADSAKHAVDDEIHEAWNQETNVEQIGGFKVRGARQNPGSVLSLLDE
ncbi:uncharacterized protein LOC105837385 [Monomorium pharaonis]|uniref:uncharacterized protein LOC105837385 n=1 Tax=Monomorium pharaonis TaxID=307658 RepID=UPI001745ECA9|nr:uncharacterized protein LOC105837385 [Monomorium pharaonis]